MENILKRMSVIKVLIFDVDGVLTDGSLYVLPDGKYMRKMNIKDGYSLRVASEKGFLVAIISGAKQEGVEARLKGLKIQHVFTGALNKKETYEQLKESCSFKDEEVLFMGDDMLDVEMIKTAGIGCCPADACTDALEIADYISQKKGGDGCVRDVIEKVMKIQGKW